MMFKVSLILTALLCALLAGFVFAFAVVVMPGSARLDDGDFIRAFQAIDGVIQGSQPLFGVVWLGSLLGALVTLGLGLGELSGARLALLGGAAALFLLAVHLPTFLVNVPLNNRLQALNVATMDDAAVTAARAGFEATWNRWNVVRTIVATAVTGSLMWLMLALP